MKWYKSLSMKQKAQIRWCFEAACGVRLNEMLLLFSFSECTDILEDKLKLLGIISEN